MGTYQTRVDCSAETYVPICPRCAWRGGARWWKAEAQLATQHHLEQIHGQHDLTSSATRRAQAGAVA